MVPKHSNPSFLSTDVDGPSNGNVCAIKISEPEFFSQRRMLGGPAPVRRFLPDLMNRVLKGAIRPGKVFDLTLPIAEVAKGYKAMDQCRAIKTLLRVD